MRLLRGAEESFVPQGWSHHVGAIMLEPSQQARSNLQSTCHGVKEDKVLPTILDMAHVVTSQAACWLYGEDVAI